MIRSLRHVEPVSSFRSTFAYTNITHMLAQRVVARAMGAEDWDDVVRAEIFEPLGMTDTSLHRRGHRGGGGHDARATAGRPTGTVEVPFTPIFPYGVRRRRGDQLDGGGPRALGAPAPRGRQLRGRRRSSRRRTSP